MEQNEFFPFVRQFSPVVPGFVWRRDVGGSHVSSNDNTGASGFAELCVLVQTLQTAAARFSKMPHLSNATQANARQPTDACSVYSAKAAYSQRRLVYWGKRSRVHALGNHVLWGKTQSHRYAAKGDGGRRSSHSLRIARVATCSTIGVRPREARRQSAQQAIGKEREREKKEKRTKSREAPNTVRKRERYFTVNNHFIL